MLLAVLIVVSVSLAAQTAGMLALRTALQVIHAATNSNMTRALNEITQLHKDITLLIAERNEAQVAIGSLSATEDLSKQLIPLVAGIAEQQRLVAVNLRIAQAAVDAVATDLAKSHQAADAKAAEGAFIPGEVADAGAQTPETRRKT